MQTTRHDGDGGWSLLELTVALAVSVVALALASGLVLEAQQRTLYEDRLTRDPAVPIALKQMRADVTFATGGSGEWPLDDALVLVTPNGSVLYSLAGDELIRTLSTGKEKTAPEGRVLMSGVKAFRWQWLTSTRKPLLEIDLDYEQPRRPGPEVRDGERVFVDFELRHETLQLALRGRGGAGW